VGHYSIHYEDWVMDSKKELLMLLRIWQWMRWAHTLSISSLKHKSLPSSDT
jgi:hypothetical protein